MRVPAFGPVGSAKLLWVGEAPGREECAAPTKGPFTGASGRVVRGALRHAGLDPSHDVRWANVLPVNPGKLTPQLHDRWLEEWWSNLDDELATTGARVIVACGGLALKRLTGLTSIADEAGGVIDAATLPRVVAVKGRGREVGLRPGTVVIPVLHPAGILRTKLQADLLPWRRWVDRVVGWVQQLSGGAAYTPATLPPLRLSPTPRELSHTFHDARTVSIDTEFNSETKVPFMVGLQGDGACRDIVILRAPLERYVEQLRALFARRDLTWASHNNSAEFATLATLGIDVTRARWYDTMLAFATLYPDLEVGLNHAALFYDDNARNWKSMAHDDVEYLRRDVWYQRVVYESTRDELERAGMMEVFENEVTACVPLAYEMERSGMRVDKVAQGEMLDALHKRHAVLGSEIHARTVGMFGLRVASASEVVDAHELAVDGVAATRPVVSVCPVHASYTGARRKKWAVDPNCECRAVYDAPEVVEWRARVAVAKVATTKVRGKARALAGRDFKPTNNHDMRWLLYDKQALALPPQLDREGKVTTGITAVRRIRTQVLEAVDAGKTRSKYYRTDSGEVFALLDAIHEYRHLEKLEATFYNPPVDADGVAHPPYRLWGAGTGRPASGADPDADDSSSEFAFNVLNIPHDVRRIFIPHDDEWMWVHADWSQLESWLTAAASGDEVMLAELRAQVAGGYKVHALNAALIYGIEPQDSKSHLVKLQGRECAAYEAGKRLSHMWNYGAQPAMLARTFWITRKFAGEIDELLRDKYARVAEWRNELANRVYGEALYVCPSCRAATSAAATCGRCSGERYRIVTRFERWMQAPARVHYTRFRRRRWYLGRRGEGANALASQEPQSGGASMAYRTWRWLVDNPPPVPHRLLTFTYDAFDGATHRDYVDTVAEWLQRAMQREWPQVRFADGTPLVVPSEVSVGWNWAEAGPTNPRGLVPWNGGVR